MLLTLSALLGFTAGARTFTPPALASIAATAGWLPVGDSLVAFLANGWLCAGLVILALLELWGDKRPQTPSRKTPGAAIARLLSGALCGAAIAATTALWSGAVIGALAALAGTWACHAGRMQLARSFGQDVPAALVEDVLTVLLAALAIWLSLPLH